MPNILSTTIKARRSNEETSVAVPESLSEDHGLKSIQNPEIKMSTQGIGHHFNSPSGQTIVALQNVDLKLRNHEFVAIVGPSGLR